MIWLYGYLLMTVLAFVVIAQRRLWVMCLCVSLLWPFVWAFILPAAVKVALQQVKRGESH